MVEAIPHTSRRLSLPPDKLLAADEIVVIVDDDQTIREPLQYYLEHHGLRTIDTGSASELRRLLETRRVALILLDIGLPDCDGAALIPQIIEQSPDVSIIMLTGVADLQIALECLRKGADDYLSKPVQFHEILFVVQKTLEKRRLIIDNRNYQQQLEKANFRTQLLHQLSIKMNTVYLTTTELDDILRAVLVGITAEEGLRFNRAFLALFDEEGRTLKGCMAIGPGCRDEAGRIWAEMKARKLDFLQIIHNLARQDQKDFPVNRIVSALTVPAADTDHILIKSALQRRSFNISGGQGDGPIPQDLLRLLEEDSFVVVPLYSPRQSYGVIIADNFVTGQPITVRDISELELFASQASLAVEQCRLYSEMEHKIQQLEDLNHELDKNKDLLIEAERFSALGQMAAQLVHAIRNPVTSIGGVARIVAKKVKGEEWQKYINVIVKEAERLEDTLQDLFDFVSHKELESEQTALYPLIRKTLMLVQSSLTKQGITLVMDLQEPEPIMEVDPHQIRQMLVHLLKNAIEAMPEGGSLTIRVSVTEVRVRINIIDTGIGISDTHFAKVRDPFFTTKTHGTGMGLTLVERIANAHGGKLSIKKHEPTGLDVQIDLPTAGPAAAPA